MIRYRVRFSRNNLDPQIKDVSTWATVDPSQLSDEQASRFKNLKEAISDYLSDVSVEKICKEKGVTKQGLIRLVKRCITMHQDGRIWGFRALISNSRQKQYERKAETNSKKKSKHGGNSGEMSKLFDRIPDIKEYIDTLFLQNYEKGVVHESQIPFKSIHKRFLERCRKEGIAPDTYPFTVKNLGYVALWKYLKKLFKQEQERGTRVRYGKDVARNLKTQLNNESERDKVTRPYQRVEFDAHRLDVFCTISIPTILGGYIKKVVDRIWLLVIIDIYTRAVLGYHFCFNNQYSKDDVLLCVKNAIIPWRKKTLTIPALKYPERGGFPSGVFKELEWALWDELAYDNAKANLAGDVRERLTSVVNCAINAGPVGMPERRPFIERFFQTLEENGYHRLPSTTGGNPRDSRRNNPEQKALEFDIELEHIEELTEVMLANYNGEPHSGIGYRSPIELLEYYINSNNILPRQIPVNQRSNLKLLDIKVTRIVRGSIASGKAPHINYEGGKYRNDVLARSPDLIGKKITLIIDPSDVRLITAFLPNGAEFGVLAAQGAWSRSPHTLTMRKEILNLKNKKLIWYTQSDDPVQIYLDYLGKKSLKSKSSRGKLVTAQRTQKAKLLSINVNEELQSHSISTERKKSKSKKKNSVKAESKKILPRLKTFTY